MNCLRITLLIAATVLLSPCYVLSQDQATALEKALLHQARKQQTLLANRNKLEPLVHKKTQAILDQLAESNDFSTAVRDCQLLFDQTILYGKTREKQAFIDAAFTLGLVRLLSNSNASKRIERLRYLRQNNQLAQELVFALKPQDNRDRVLNVLDKLRRRAKKSLDPYANLVAAVCVVHDNPLVHRINENATTGESPELILQFYIENERAMFYPLKKTPVELLIYTIDNAVSVREMKWALRRYQGDRAVGKLFFTIEYDDDHFLRGKEKKVTGAGWSLPNILKYGGVCADQAYFAVAVGKTIGVPTAYTVGRGGEMAHAWVGFFESKGNNGWWNFDIGRYDAYQGVKGSVYDPQTQAHTSDSFVSLQGFLLGTNRDDRRFVSAMTLSARRLLKLADTSGDSVVASPFEHKEDPPPVEPVRQATQSDALDLLEAGLRNCKGHLPAWLLVRDLAVSGKLTLSDKKIWAKRIEQLCGKSYPDFSLEILRPMIATIDDADEQNKLWNGAFHMFRHRADLAAEVRVAQGDMWRKQGETKKAGLCYMDVVEQFANGGPFTLTALQRVEKLLNEAGKGDRVLQAYALTWDQLNKPRQSAFRNQSNWYRIGMMYADKLEHAGHADEANKVRRTVKGE